MVESRPASRDLRTVNEDREVALAFLWLASALLAVVLESLVPSLVVLGVLAYGLYIGSEAAARNPVSVAALVTGALAPLSGLLGVLAVVFGIDGLVSRDARAHPETRVIAGTGLVFGLVVLAILIFA